MECRKQLCEKCKKKEDDYFLVTLTPSNPTPAECIDPKFLDKKIQNEKEKAYN